MDNVRVLFEDNHLLVLDKPPGLPTQPTPTSEVSLETSAKKWLKNKYQKPGNVYLHAIYRLDAPVGGVVVFAKTSKALSRMQAEVREKRVRKFYTAWVEGDIKAESGVLEHYLVHDEHFARESRDGKLCRLSFKVKARQKGRTLVEIELDTGRYHQIRAQFALSGHPVVGDSKYGSKSASKEIALQHVKWIGKHPVTGVEMVFESAASF